MIQTVFRTCDLCGSDRQELLYSRTDPITDQEFHLVECECGMAFVNPAPTPDSIPRLYPEDYLEDKPLMTAMYRRMLTFLPEDPKGRLLDIGCGRGDFIHTAAQAGWDAEGVDIIDWSNPYGLPIRVGDFATLDFPERQYDAITAWAVLEHLYAPSVYFEKIARLLKTDGRFVLLVPNYTAPGMRRTCTDDIPRHLHLFSPKSVRAYTEKHGMAIEAIRHRNSVYAAYPFGLIRRFLHGISDRETRCEAFENRSVAVLRNRQIKGNVREWLSEVRQSLGWGDMVIDLADIGLAVSLAQVSKMIGNYGIITVTARKTH